MAPLCSDPRQIVISLNPARRQALLRLVDEITSYMISELEIPCEELGSVTTEVDFDERDGASGRQGAPKPPNQAQEPAKQQPNIKASKQAQKIQKAAVKHMQEWKKEILPKLEEIVHVEDTPKIKAERQARVEALQKKSLDTPEEGEDLISFGEVKINRSEDIASTNMLYHPIPTRLTTIPAVDRREALCCVLLLLLSTGKYSAHSRALILYLASSLEMSQAFVNTQEAEIAKSLLESSSGDKDKDEAMSAEAEAAKRRQDNKFSRFWKVGLASVAGATIIGVTGGLAAPLVAGALGGVLGGVGLGGVASFLGIFWMNGALVGALFGAYGAKMTGEMMDNYAKEVEDFRFISLEEEFGKDSKQQSPQDIAASRRLRVTIGINGWLNSEDDVTRPWRVMNTETEVFALRYEMKTLLALGTALQDMVSSFAWKALKMEIIKRTVLATLMAALWPIQVLTAASNIDNPFSRANNRSRKAGQLLADALINRVPGERPVTLIGYSLGATVIHACLQSLAERHAFGLIDTVVIIGTPAPSTPAHWRTVRTVVSGKIFNVYSENDMVLGLVYRMHSLAAGVAGLQAIEGVEGIENLDLSGSISGHLRYAELTGEILRRCGFLGVKAGMEIAKDDVIQMKDDHAEGKLVDFEESGQKKENIEAVKGEMANELRGLTISPPALTPPVASPSSPPPLPERRQTQDAGSETQSIPRRPVGAILSPAKPTEPGISKQGIDNRDDDDWPVPVVEKNKGNWNSRQERPLTPTTNDSDDGEYRAITMQNNDSD